VSLFRRSTSNTIEIPSRPSRRNGPVVSTPQALGQSVVWAACRLRADLVSLMPVDVFRKVGTRNVPVSPPPVLVEPAEIADGHPMLFGEWMGSGQMGLDTTGNNWGVIRAVDALNLPAQIELVDPDLVSARIRDGRILQYRINGENVDTRYMWHERQFTIPGLPIGLSPIAHAAWNLKGAVSAQQFAVDWFVNGAVPSAMLRNTERTLRGVDTDKVKERFKTTTSNGDVFVTGKDWEYTALSAKAAESAFIEQMQYSDVALARFFGVPGDLVDVITQTGTVTYANITQRNLQLLVMNLGNTVKRREDTFSRFLVPRPRFVKLNRSAVLAMDAKSRAELHDLRIKSRTLTPDEARLLDDQEPLTDEQYAQFDRLFGARGQSPQASAPEGN
jgi:HK97 family phage portal protein